MGNRVYHLSVVDMKPGAVPQRRERRVGFPPPWLTGLDDAASLPSSTPPDDPVSQGSPKPPQNMDRSPGARCPVGGSLGPWGCRSAPVQIDAAAMPAMSPIPRCLAFAALLVTALLLAPGLAQAGDYDRNVVLSRELGVGAMMLPLDGAPVAFLARATARSHVRHFYFGGELSAGFVLDVRPMVSTAATIGMESADNAWEPLRAYGEAGGGLFWAMSSPRELLNFHIEGGVRYLVRSYRRPHLSLHMGVRALTNFGHAGGTVICGATWTFD